MLKVGIIGVTGYTGMELVRILLGHPHVHLSYASSRSLGGQRIGDVMPHLNVTSELVLSEFDTTHASGEADIFFTCLPHGESMETVGQLRKVGRKVVDLSADFRIKDPSVYEKWYGPHTQIELLSEAVYGLPELYRGKIQNTELTANPGCYPTSVILGLAPLLAEEKIFQNNIVIDSKSGVSGAGREPKPGFHFPEVFGNFSAYSVAGQHRHIGEMEQELSGLAGGDIRITFSPHLLPVSRGILSTIYAGPLGQIDNEGLHSLYLEYYRDEPFVRINSPDMALPSLKDVRGTNFCRIGTRIDDRTGTCIIFSCIDNLVKGASGQAVQNMNLMMGFDETTGIEGAALHP